MAKIEPSKCQISRLKEFFFDTNIWILLYAPNGDYQKMDQKIYSAFFDNILEKDSPIYINSIIISEYANAILRRDYNIWKEEQFKIGNTNLDFKRDFFKTQEYRSSFHIVSTTLNQILALPNIIKLSDDFSSSNLENIIECCPELDFNDSFIAFHVNRRKFSFVTNDSDFSSKHIFNEFISTK